MTFNLNATNLDITDPDLQDAYDDLQGGILKGHGRDLARHVFVRFGGDPAAARRWLAGLADGVTSARQQHEDAVAWKATGTEHLFTSVLLTASGYRALGVDELAIPREKAFRAGMKDLTTPYNTAPRGDHKPTPNPLADDPTTWEDAFQQDVHALVMFAYGSSDGEEEATQVLDDEVASVTTSLDGLGEVLCVQYGHVLRNNLGQVIEHFGFTDGVSDPLILKHDLDDAFANGGFEHYDPSINIGGVVVPDPGGGPDAFGSFAVYRKLQQNVRGFADQVGELAGALDVDESRAGALVMGRFKDGTPVGEQSGDGWTNEFNDYNYDDDPTGLRCPLASHARRTNPRGDTYRRFGSPVTIERSRRIMRSGISYGSTDLDPTEEWTEAGLLFLCFQANIEDQFIFIQHTWSNNQDFLEDGVGTDPIVGQVLPGENPVAQVWPKDWGRPHSQTDSTFGGAVRTRGGEYFFTPSRSMLRNLAAADAAITG